VELGHHPILSEADPTRLAQVVSKLVDHAATYTPEEGRVSVALVPLGDQVEVVVSDSGLGITPERANLMFEPFAHVEQTPDTASGGLGLGLALVKRLTELHGGAVNVASRGPDQRSAFTMRLPIRSPQLNA